MVLLRRRGLAAVLCSLGTPLAWAQSAASPGVSDTEILLGQSCQLSGPLEGITREVRQGASLCFDHINAQGGVRGRKIRVLALDDAYDPKKAEANTRHFINEAKVLALFQYAGTPPALAGMALAEQTGVPLIAPFTGAEELRKPELRYVFNIKAGYATELHAMLRHLASVGLRSVAAVYLDNPFGLGGLAALQASARELNVQLLATAPLQVNGSNLAQAVAHVGQHHPKAVIVISAGKPSVDFIAAYQATGRPTLFYVLSVISNVQLAQGLGERARGVVVSQVVPPPWSAGLELTREFQRLAKAQGLQEFTFSQMEGFLSAKFLVEALQRAGPQPTRASLIHAMEGMQLSLGGYPIRLSARQHSSGRFVDLLMLSKDGSFAR
ncbi:MAG: ABC transporter substrate-binding protein [Comamonas sp.]|nr:ABC transporter substrate-binding protein [Comamonas sp.]